MKQTTRTFTMVLLLLIGVMLFSVIGSASVMGAEESDSNALSIASVFDRAKTELCEASYIGTYCKTAFEGLDQIAEWHFLIFGVIALIQCFFGYRLLRVELFLIGLLGGFVGGLMLYPSIAKLITGMPGYVELIVAGVLGLVGALLVHFFFKVAVFAGVGYLVFLYSAPYFENINNGLLYRILIAIGCGIIAFFLIRLVFVLGTSLLGGMIAMTQFLGKVEAMQKVLYSNSITQKVFEYTGMLGIKEITIALAIGAAVGIFGMIFQFANTRRRRA